MRKSFPCAFLAAALLLPCVNAAAREPSAEFHEADAVLINVTEHDLNRIVRDLFRSQGGPSFEGTQRRPSGGISGLEYHANLSDPVLRLQDDGRARLTMGILEGDLRIGSLERRFMRRTARCEDIRMFIDPDQPVDVSVEMRFSVDDGELIVVPDAVRLGNKDRAFRLVRPARCSNTFLPKWLLWWIGKPHLRRRIDRLDEALLEKARKGARELSEEALFRKRWQFDSADGERRLEGLHLYPGSVDTAGGSLLVSLTGSSSEKQAGGPVSPAWVGPRSERSFVGLSETFLDSMLRSALLGAQSRPRRPTGNMSKLFTSDAIYTLIPGLRGLDSRENLYLTFAIRSAPDIEFENVPAADHDRALIRLRLSDIEIQVRDRSGSVDRLLGAIEIASGRVGVLPYANLLGGISFEVVENEWSLSSRGIEFNEDVLAATLQEMIFGEIFETGFEPVARNALDVGETDFTPRYFEIVGRHLLVGLAGLVD